MFTEDGNLVSDLLVRSGHDCCLLDMNIVPSRVQILEKRVRNGILCLKQSYQDISRAYLVHSLCFITMVQRILNELVR